MYIENMAEAIYVNSKEVRGDNLSVIRVRATANNENIYANVENTQLETKDKAEHQRSGCAQRSRTVAVCLGVLCFLLLAVIIGLQVNYSRLTGLHDSEMQCLRAQNKNLTEDNNQLKTSYDNLTEQFNIVGKKKDLLQKTVDNVCHKARDDCPGWKVLGCKCYLISTSTSNMKTWKESRQYCQSYGADLVIINSREEHEFLMMNYIDWAWIGLSDRASEGTWKWVDGTTLQGEVFWLAGKPNNAKRNKDCVHLQIIKGRKGWNDARCTQKFNWICEK